MASYHGTRVSPEWLTVLNAAERDLGRPLDLNSGQRTMREQAALYRIYKAGGNLAAVPSPTAPHIRVGRPDHALDVDTGRGDAYWLDAWARKHGYDLDNTVPGEAWHKEIRGGPDALRRFASDLGADHDPTLRLGSVGPSVVRLKKLLYDNGIRDFSVGASSNRYEPTFNHHTKAAVKRFQRRRGITPADGIVGSQTWRALRHRG